MERFGSVLLFTRRPCELKRCDFRDCESLLYSLVDLMNLARTRLILGSGYSSYSEVASQVGGSRGKVRCPPTPHAHAPVIIIISQSRAELHRSPRRPRHPLPAA